MADTAALGRRRTSLTGKKVMDDADLLQAGVQVAPPPWDTLYGSGNTGAMPAVDERCSIVLSLDRDVNRFLHHLGTMQGTSNSWRTKMQESLYIALQDKKARGTVTDVLIPTEADFDLLIKVADEVNRTNDLYEAGAFACRVWLCFQKMHMRISILYKQINKGDGVMPTATNLFPLFMDLTGGRDVKDEEVDHVLCFIDKNLGPVGMDRLLPFAVCIWYCDISGELCKQSNGSFLESITSVIRTRLSVRSAKNDGKTVSL